MLTEYELSLLRNQMEQQSEQLRRAVHDVRNPLTVLSSSLQLLESSQPNLSSLSTWKLVRAGIQDLVDSFAYLNQVCGDIESMPDKIRQ